MATKTRKPKTPAPKAKSRRRQAPSLLKDDVRSAVLKLIDLGRRFEENGTLGSPRADSRLAEVVHLLSTQRAAELRDLEHRFVVDLVNGLADIYARVKTGKLDRSAFQEAVEDHFFAFGIRQLNRRSLQYLTKVEFISERGGPVNFAAEAVESVLGTGASARSIFEWRKAGGRPNHGHRERRQQLLERLLFVAHLLQWATRRSDWILLREVEILTRWRLRKFRDRPLPKPPLN